MFLDKFKERGNVDSYKQGSLLKALHMHMDYITKRLFP